MTTHCGQKAVYNTAKTVWLHLVLKCILEKAAYIDLKRSIKFKFYVIYAFLVNSSQSDSAMILNRQGRVQFIPWPSGTGLGGFW